MTAREANAKIQAQDDVYYYALLDSPQKQTALDALAAIADDPEIPEPSRRWARAVGARCRALRAWAKAEEEAQEAREEEAEAWAEARKAAWAAEAAEAAEAKEAGR